MRHRGLLSLAAVAAVGAMVAGWLVVQDSGDDGTRAGGSTKLSTAPIERRDLVERDTLEGSLGFADERVLASGRSGTITSIADEGATLRRGEVLFEVDGKPTVLMYGQVPAYRSLSLDAGGPDVKQLQRNLLALGYTADGDLEVDGTFDSDTAEAVKDWQEGLGLDRTGMVELGDVAFLPGPRRMGQHSDEVGNGVAPGTQVASTTSPDRVVSMNVDVTDQDLLAKGDHVRVRLPDGSSVGGRVTSVGTVAEVDPDDVSADPTVPVEIRLTGDVQTELDEAPVDVDVEISRAKGVLAVPVDALLALAEGGYALEVVDGPGRTHLAGVETGDFASGYVEVSGRAITEGTEVVTAQ